MNVDQSSLAAWHHPVAVTPLVSSSWDFWNPEFGTRLDHLLSKKSWFQEAEWPSIEGSRKMRKHRGEWTKIFRLSDFLEVQKKSISVLVPFGQTLQAERLIQCKKNLRIPSNIKKGFWPELRIHRFELEFFDRNCFANSKYFVQKIKNTRHRGQTGWSFDRQFGLSHTKNSWVTPPHLSWVENPRRG